MNFHIKYRQLKAFALAVETGSFKAGAEKLSVTQPSFSAMIKNLESDVNVRLFDRTTRTCALTQAGRMCYEQVSEGIAQIEDAYGFMMDVGGGQRGRLTIAALPSLSSGVVTNRLALFQKQYPRVRIGLSEGKNAEIIETVRRGDVELGVASLLTPDRDLTFERCFTDHLMYVVPEGHPLQKGPATWKSAE